ncbi:MAG: hypothetical protein Q8P92_03795 [Candidatus Daviesbacteria bacterium]|nr:hypothetical protein [Candidatus Daviesbacteria bacterium]
MPTSKGSVNPVVIIVVLAIAAIGGYFFLSQKGSLPSPSLPSTSTLTPRATEKDFESITEDPTLRKHFAAQANKTDYRYKGTSPGSGLTTVNEVQIKGESVNSKEIESDGSKEKKHLIILGDTTYLKDYSDNKWWKQTIKPEEIPDEEGAEEPKDFKEEYSQPDLQYKSLGKEDCGSHASGLTCFKYEQIFPDSPETKRFFWFDDKDYLLRKDQAGFGEFIATIEYSYDNINITTPSPTKDVPEGRSIYEYSLGSDTMTPPSPTENQIPEIPTDLNMGEQNTEEPLDY